MINWNKSSDGLPVDGMSVLGWNEKQPIICERDNGDWVCSYTGLIVYVSHWSEVEEPNQANTSKVEHKKTKINSSEVWKKD